MKFIVSNNDDEKTSTQLDAYSQFIHIKHFLEKPVFFTQQKHDIIRSSSIAVANAGAVVVLEQQSFDDVGSIP